MFDEIPIQIPKTFYTEIEKSILKFMWKHKRPRIPKAILSKKSIARASQYLTLNYINRAIVTKIARYWHKNRHED
jgi:hypothetical protein